MTGNSLIPRSVAKNAIIAFLFILAISQALNLDGMMPIGWMCISTFTVIMFFIFLIRLTKRFERNDVTSFKKKLFWLSFWIRASFVVFFYFFFDYLYGQPFEFNAADSMTYNRLGIEISNSILNGNFDFSNLLENLDLSDCGFPVFLGILYSILFKSILISRLVNAGMGAWTCVLVYDIAKRNFNEPTAKIASVLMLLCPPLIYYCAVTLKETMMIFMVVTFIATADKLIRKHQASFKLIWVILISICMLFLLRTVLAVCLILSLIVTLVIVSHRVTTLTRRIFLSFWVTTAIYILLSSSVGQEINKYIEQKGTNLSSRLQHYAQKSGGNKYADYGSTSIFAPLILMVPFPTLVDTAQENQMMLAGAYFTKSIIAFFVLIAIVVMYKRRILRNHTLIIASLISYLIVIASSGFALSGRFHLPVIPLICILAAFGLNQMNLKQFRLYIPYLLILSTIMIGWNWFKLAGRGLID